MYATLRRLFIVYLQESLRDPPFGFRLLVKVLDQELRDLALVDIGIRLHGGIALRCAVMSAQSRQAIESLADRIEP
jgi:hypothetical protein